MPGSDGSLPGATDEIIIPPTGIKPNINLSATFNPSDVMSELQIRLVNYYPSAPLSSYRWMTVQAGYKHNPDTAVISGQVMVAYNESPAPDGVTFISMLVGQVDDVLNREVSLSIPPQGGQTTDTILNGVISALGSTGTTWHLVNNSSLKAIPLDGAGFNFVGKAINCMNVIKDRWKIAYLIEGTNLIIYDPNAGRTSEEVIVINYLSSPPMANAAGISFVAPWNPKLRPGMVIQINPLFFRQTFGGAQISYQKDGLMICQTIDLQFNTVTNQNQMTVLALNTYEVPQVSGS